MSRSPRVFARWAFTIFVFLLLVRIGPRLLGEVRGTPTALVAALLAAAALLFVLVRRRRRR